jgi:hypothetical protein
VSLRRNMFSSFEIPLDQEFQWSSVDFVYLFSDFFVHLELFMRIVFNLYI